MSEQPGFRGELAQQGPDNWFVYSAAQVAAEAQAAALDAQYEGAKERLNTVLTGTVARSVEDEIAIRRGNMALVDKVLTLLPKADKVVPASVDPGRHYPKLYEFHPSNHSDARKVQSQVLWKTSSQFYSWSDFIPYYIIGQTKNPGRLGHLNLLAIHAIADAQLFMVDTPVRNFKNVRSIRDELLDTNPSADDVAEVFDTTKHVFQVNGRENNSLTSEYVPGMFTNSKKYIKKYGYTADFNVPANSTTSIGPSNEDMATYDIYGHLGKLAAIFEVSQPYMAILEQYTQGNKKDS